MADTCTCAMDGNARRCPFHTQEDFDAQKRNRIGYKTNHHELEDLLHDYTQKRDWKGVEVITRALGVMMANDVEYTPPPIIPDGHTMTKRQLLHWLELVNDDDPITVAKPDGSWWYNLVGIDANPENMTIILDTRDDFDPATAQWEVQP